MLSLLTVALATSRGVPRTRTCSARPLPSMSSVAPAAVGLGSSLPMPEALSAAMLARGISEPTPIQSASFDRILTGESVVLHAETGSGKSLAFLLPAAIRLDPEGKLLVVAPTRELAVQLGAEAAFIMAALGGDVQLAIVGTSPTFEALAAARVLVGTPAELQFVLCESPFAAQLTAAFTASLRTIVLDEVDRLLPVTSTFGPQAARMKRQSNRAKEHVSPTELLLLALLERTPQPGLQLVAASATASKTTRSKLHRVLRRDQYGRWFDSPPEIVRPAELGGEDLSARPRAVTVPAGVSHRFWPVERLAAPKLAVAVRDALRVLAPTSALVFVCKSANLTVADATAALRAAGLPALALHDALGLRRSAPTEAAGGAGLRPDAAAGAPGPDEAEAGSTLELLQRHGALAAGFSAQLAQGRSRRSEAKAGEPDGPPLIVTFEDNARGLHFDAVEVVFVLGQPSSPAAYLHLAGRTGRQPVLRGLVVTVCTRRSARELSSWSSQLGGVEFAEVSGNVLSD